MPVKIVNRTQGTVIAERAELAQSLWSRFMGLMGKRDLPPGGGLVLTDQTGGVHMFFMRFPLDVVFIAKDRSVVKVVSNLKPWRISDPIVAGSRHAIEVPVGAIARSRTQIGDTIEWVETP